MRESRSGGSTAHEEGRRLSELEAGEHRGREHKVEPQLALRLQLKLEHGGALYRAARPLLPEVARPEGNLDERSHPKRSVRCLSLPPLGVRDDTHRELFGQISNDEHRDEREAHGDRLKGVRWRGVAWGGVGES